MPGRARGEKLKAVRPGNRKRQSQKEIQSNE